MLAQVVRVDRRAILLAPSVVATHAQPERERGEDDERRDPGALGEQRELLRVPGVRERRGCRDRDDRGEPVVDGLGHLVPEGIAEEPEPIGHEAGEEHGRDAHGQTRENDR